MVFAQEPPRSLSELHHHIHGLQQIFLSGGVVVLNGGRVICPDLERHLVVRADRRRPAAAAAARAESFTT